LKKKIGMGIGLVILLLLVTGVVWFFSRNLTISTARCIVTKQNCMMVLDNSPIGMSNQSWDKELFEDLDTGDKILVVHDGIAESYPGQTGAYFIFRLEEGSIADVPAQVIESLGALGYVIDGD